MLTTTVKCATTIMMVTMKGQCGNDDDTDKYNDEEVRMTEAMRSVTRVMTSAAT